MTAAYFYTKINTFISMEISLIHHLFVDTGCSSKDHLEVMNDKDGWQESVKELCAANVN